MACNNLCAPSAGIDLSCKSNTPGVSKIFVACFDDAVEYAVDANDVITGITSGNTFYEFNLPKSTANFDEVVNSDGTTGAVEYVPTVNIAVNKLRAGLRNQFKLLVKGTQTIIVKTLNGDYILFGKEQGLDLAGSAVSGTAGTDRNGYEYAFTGREPEPAQFVEFSAFSALIDDTTKV